MIDDEEFVHKSWKMAAKKHGDNLTCFFEVNSFLKESYKFDKNTEVFIDENLGNNQLGHQVSKLIYDNGFKNIILSTGMFIEKLPTWLLRQQEKKYPC